nr:ribonuclease H-like domain, reverse transcriptase, RNA-dependent DNA polymerase [Tanacetum cinerariifolium]
MKLFKTLSLDESRSPNFNLFSDQEEYSEEEVAQTMAETMEQYMSKTRADYGSGIAKPKIKDNVRFELKGQFLKELLDNTFSGSGHEDANEHIEKIIKIVNLFQIPNITQDKVMLKAFPMSLTGDVNNARDPTTSKIARLKKKVKPLKKPTTLNLDKLEYKGNNVVGALMNIPIFVGTFSLLTNFAVLENMDAYRDEGMGDVIFRESFLREIEINARRFDGMITIYNGNDKEDTAYLCQHFTKDHKGTRINTSYPEKPICRIQVIEGLGYNVVPPPYTGNFMSPKPNLVYPSLDDFVDVNESVSESVVEKPIIETNEPKTASKENEAPIIKDWVSELDIAGPIKNVINNAYSTVRRPIHKKTSSKNSNFNQGVNTIRAKHINTARPKVNIARPKVVLNAVQGNYGNLQQDLKDKGVIDNGCSRHMIGNRSYLTDYEEIDRGFVAFRGSVRNQSNGSACTKACDNVGEEEKKDAEDTRNEDNKVPSTEEPRVSRERFYGCADGLNIPDLEEIVRFSYAENDDSGADMNNLDTYFQVSPIPTTRIHKDHPLNHVIGDLQSTTQTRQMTKNLEEYGFTASTPMETHKTLLKDEKGEDVDEHLYRSMIGSLMYLTSSRPDIMFVVCAYARFQDSPFDLVEYIDNDYAGASLDRKCTTGGCQFLGFRLISWQCKKQTVVSNSTTEAEYVAASSYCGQATAEVKNINGEVQLHAKVDGKKVVISEASIRRDLQFRDEGGIDCLPNETIFEQVLLMGYEKLTQKLTFYKAFFSSQWKFLIHTILQCLGAKTIAWNEFSSTISSAVICLATDQKFNFSKYIFDNMVKNLDSATKILMFPRKQKPKKTRRHDTELPQTSMPIETVADEALNEENVPTQSNDPPLSRVKALGSGEDSLKLKELMELYIKLSDGVLNLETTKTAQSKEITSLKRRFKRLEKKMRSRTYGLKRLYKVKLSARVESSANEAHLDEDSAFKQGRISNINASQDIYLVNFHRDKDIFSVNDQDDTSTFNANKDLQVMEIKVLRPKAKDIIMQEPNEAPTTIIPLPSKVQDKGKGMMVEEPLKMKKKYQISFDEQEARRLQAEIDEQDRLVVEEA